MQLSETTYVVLGLENTKWDESIVYCLLSYAL